MSPIETHATILMCDIEGFAALTDELGPRRVFAFLDAYFDALTEVVQRHGGAVTQFQGDAILAAFNVPRPQVHHAESALRAALEIVRVCDERDFAGVRVRNRIGLASGRVVAGMVGAHRQQSFTVHGNPVNLAARLELLNKDYGTRVLLDAATATACSGFALRKVGDAEIRGYAGTLPVFTPG
jgi:adenylate cyclase